MIFLSILRRVPFWAWLVAAALAWGGWARLGAMRAEHRIKDAERRASQLELDLQVSEAARVAERKAQEVNKRIANDHQTKVRAAADRASGARERLRVQAAAARASDPAGASCGNHAAPVAVIHGPAREALVDLARDADEVTIQLQSCQAWINEQRKIAQ